MAKILVVDDDPDLLALVVRRLLKAGHRVQEASNGSAALALMREKGSPDVLVLDVVMPGLTGLQLLVAARELTGNPKLPAVFLSGRIEPVDLAFGQDLGAAYLTKPYVSSALLAAIDAQLEAAEVFAPSAW